MAICGSLEGHAITSGLTFKADVSAVLGHKLEVEIEIMATLSGFIV